MRSKHQKQNKPTSKLAPIKRSEPIKMSGSDVEEDYINHYKPDKNDDGNKTDETIKKLPQ